MPDRRGGDALSIPRHVVEAAAKVSGVCARPVISRVTDLETGEAQIVAIACGSTREDRCPTCADRARRLRIQQCREGWHLDTEPEHDPPDAVATGARTTTRATSDEPASGGCARPGAARTCPTCPGCRWRTGPSAACSPPRTAGPTGPRCSSP